MHIWGSIGKGSMGARQVVGRVLGLAWSALDHVCEAFGTAAITVLATVRRTLEAAFYAVR